MTDYAAWIKQYPGVRKKSRLLWVSIRQEFDFQKPPMTVRQVFYRMSSQGIIPKTESGYRQTQYALTAMRRAGAIPYGYIADSTRWVRRVNAVNNLREALEDMHEYYRRRLWANQNAHVEIWLEKDALAGVITPVTEQYDVPLYVTRGYASLSYLYEAAESLKGIEKPIYIYHFGDYDASGQDAARAVNEGLRNFGAHFEFIKAAVTPAQITELGLQTRPAKKKDPRAGSHGDIAVELDAIPPNELRGMVNSVIHNHIDMGSLWKTLEIERQEKEILEEIAFSY